MKKLYIYSFILALTAFMIPACSNFTEPEGDGKIKINLIDAPSKLDSVIVDVVRVEVHKNGTSDESGWVIVNEVNKKFDLLKLTNGASAILGNNPLPSGYYNQIRLVLGNDNYVINKGIRYNLIVPSGKRTGIKLDYYFTVEPNVPIEFYLDFDADKSIQLTTSGEYKLNPVIRVQPASTAGSISGFVVPIEAEIKVWTVAGTDTLVSYPDPTGYFKLVAVPAGNYIVHFTPGIEGFYEGSLYDVQVFILTETNLGTIYLN